MPLSPSPRRQFLAALPLVAQAAVPRAAAPSATAPSAAAPSTARPQSERAQPAAPAKPGMRPINPTEGNYAEAMELTRFQRLVFVSGQVPVGKDDRVPPTFREQARVAWANVAAQLAQADMTLQHIVRMTIYLSDRRYRGEAYEARHEVLGSHCPAMTIIICGIYREEWLLEIEAIAAA